MNDNMSSVTFTVIAANIPVNTYSISLTCPFNVVFSEFCNNYNMIKKEFMLIWNDIVLDLYQTPDYYQLPNNAVLVIVPRQ